MSDSLNIGFIGLGLIGGSIAKSLKRFHPQTRIFAYTRTEATLDLAVSEGIVDIKCTKEDEAFASCDYIFLCAPVHDNISYLEWLKDHILSLIHIYNFSSPYYRIMISTDIRSNQHDKKSNRNCLHTTGCSHRLSLIHIWIPLVFACF